MAWENPGLLETAVAEEDLSSKQYTAVSNAGNIATLTSDVAATFAPTQGTDPVVFGELVVVLNGATLAYDFDGSEVDVASMLAALQAAPVFAGLIAFNEGTGGDAGKIVFTANPSSLPTSMQVTGDSLNTLFTSVPSALATGTRKHGIKSALAGGQVLGLLQNDPKEDETAAVAVSGRSKAVAGVVPINTGDSVKVGADSKLVKADPGDSALGTAATPALNADDVFTVHLDKHTAV